MDLSIRMRLKPNSFFTIHPYAALLAAVLLSALPRAAAAQPANSPAQVCASPTQGSPYIPVDSWIYPAVLRLHALGYVDTVYLGMRPWTRASVSHMLAESAPIIDDASSYSEPTVDEAQGIFDALAREIHYSIATECLLETGNVHIESAYSTSRTLSGTTLRDSFHLGSTLINDYGRPYESGENDYSGLSGYATAGRFVFYARGEFQGAPSGAGYSKPLANNLSTNVDLITFLNPVTNQPYSQPTIPLSPIGATTQGRLLEAYVSTHLLNHIVSFGKQDEWLGPAQGGSMAYSNNAENIYALHINRIEPLHIPLLSQLTGPFRYEFLVGALKGHTYEPAPPSSGSLLPGSPWVHVEKVSFRPTRDLEFGFERTAIWGGKGHEPITLHTFLQSFFSTSAGGNAKLTTSDPGARFGAFDFSYRLPYLRNWLTLYSDSEVHDDVSPIDAPRRAGLRPGLYLSHVPGLHKLDIRVEAASTAPSCNVSDPTHKTAGYPQDGRFMYYEGVVRQGYTNNGQLFGDWIGREDKGGQAWITWHLSGNEWLQASVRNQKATTDFIPGGTTLNDLDFQAVKRIGKDFEVNGKFQLEHWKAPIFPTGQPVYPASLNTVTATTIQLTWFPKQKLHF